MNSTPVVRRVTAGTLLALSLAVLAVMGLGIHGDGALVVVTIFAVTAPGWVVAGFVAPASVALEWTIAVATSIALVIGLAMAMVMVGGWYPMAGMLALAAATAVGLGWHLVRPARTESARTESARTESAR